MSTRVKTGGRKAGVLNKATVARAGAPEHAPNVSPGAGAREDTKFPAYRLARVDQLVPYDRNARTHSPEQIALLVRLIQEFGFTNPVLVDGERGVIAGHGRVLAAMKLGMVEVPTIELSHLTDAQRRAYVIADNQSALKAGWDDDLLRLELGELRDIGFDLSLSGFDGLELAALFDEAEAPTSAADAPDEGGLDGKVCCPGCGYEFKTVAKAFRLIAEKT